MTSWTEILKANKGLYARDSFSELWGLKLKAARAEFPDYTITGTLPLSFNSRVAGALKNYRIYGDSDGAGVQTENLFDGYGTFGKYNPDTTISVIDAKTIYITGIYYVYQIYQVKPNTNYYLYTIPYSDDSQAGSMITGVNNAGTAPNMSDVVNNYSPTNFSFSFNTGGRNYIALLLYGSASNVAGTVTYSNTMLVEGSIVPASYIPHGYKIPILNTSGVTENLFDKNEITENYYINENGEIMAYNGFGYSDPMPVSSGNYAISNLTKGDGSGWSCRIHGYDADGNWVRQIKVVAVNDALMSSSFIVDSDITDIRISIKFINGQNLNVLMITPGSTAPDHYIPHRYESNYDLFIGDTKLYEDEYLDFGEQKVYKITPNNGVSARNPNPQFTIVNNGDGSYRVYHNTISSPYESIQVMPYISGVVHIECDITFNKITTNGFLIGLRKNSNNTFYPAGTGIFVKATGTYKIRKTIDTGDVEVYLSVCDLNSSAVPNQEYDYTISNIRLYVNPQDPPAPLPTIQTYQGENTLSSTETVGEVSITGKITEMA